MISHTTKRFREVFKQLPEHIQRQAKEAYKLFKQDPFHPSLRFKQIHPTNPIYSVRISRDYRAVGVRDRNEMVWYWVGIHADYDKLIAQLWRL